MGKKFLRDWEPQGKDWFTALTGRVPLGVLSRILECGGRPDRGPGRYSVPNAIRALREGSTSSLPTRNNSRIISGRPKGKRRYFPW